MPRDLPVVDYENPHSAVESISHAKTLLSCLPGLLALCIYAGSQFWTIPNFVAYLFWPLLAIGVILGVGFMARFRRRYPRPNRPWVISAAMAGHALVLIVGMPFLLLMLVSLFVNPLIPFSGASFRPIFIMGGS